MMAPGSSRATRMLPVGSLGSCSAYDTAAGVCRRARASVASGANISAAGPAPPAGLASAAGAAESGGSGRCWGEPVSVLMPLPTQSKDMPTPVRATTNRNSEA